ncbi:sigma-70 family RNA polymerase sigma factor [Vulgatibacter sp.]|uniref:sigma-70 family RNA polymerase sigma factor n=1 Tax=Vulgatibacter sp. TaxID=1971226 RepID=UPI003568B08C
MNEHDIELPTSRPVIDTLVAGHREFLSFLERRVGDRALAEDILQEAFVRSIGKAEDLRSEESVRAWFYRTLRNAVVDHYRRRGTSEKALERVAAEMDEAVEPDAELASAVCGCIARLADTLKPEYAEAIKRVEVEGLAVKEFAETAGITANNAAVRVHRAREALRKRVVTSCGSCASHGCLDCTCKP